MASHHIHGLQSLTLGFLPPLMLCYAKSLQSCPTLCDPIDSSPPGSPVPGILQATTLEWVAISFSNAWKWKVKVKSLSRVPLSATPWTAAYQAPPSMGFSRQDYWSGVPLPSPATSHTTSLFFSSLFFFLFLPYSSSCSTPTDLGTVPQPQGVFTGCTYFPVFYMVYSLNSFESFLKWYLR